MLTKLIPEILAGELLRGLSESLTAKSLCTTEYEGQIKGKGDTITIPKATAVSIYPYLGTINWEDISDDGVDIVINQENAFSAKIKDTDKAKTTFDLANTYLSSGKTGLANVADETIYKTMVLGAHNDNVIPTITLTASNIYDTLILANKKLGLQKVPANAEKFAVLSPEEVALLIQSNIMTRSSDLSDNVVVTGRVGRVLGFDIIESNNVYTEDPDDLTTSDDVHRILPYGVKGATAYADAIPIESVEQIRLQDSFATGIRGLHNFGVKVILPEAVGAIKVDTGVNGNN